MRSAFFTTGTDSPVSAHSLINADPYNITASNGNLMASLRNTRSPGTTSTDEILTTYPALKT